jgi:orotate phosphoribosyltransferase
VLSHPAVRAQVRDAFAALVRAKYPSAEVIAGVATGAIAHGVLVAEALGLPFVYVRSAPKGHGLENLIEGEYTAGQKVVVIEDLISTGGSSLKAVEALRGAGLDVLGMAAIFTYGFDTAVRNFAEAGVALDTLSDYPTLIALAGEQGYVKPEDMETLKKWREDPANFELTTKL